VIGRGQRSLTREREREREDNVILSMCASAVMGFKLGDGWKYPCRVEVTGWEYYFMMN